MAEAPTSVVIEPWLVERIDRLAEREHRTRAELVNELLASRFDESDDPEAIDRAIVESYTRHPQEVVGGEWAARQAILEEPWTDAAR